MGMMASWTRGGRGLPAALLSGALLVGGLGCAAHYAERRSGARLADVDAEAPVLKLHLANGEVYLLSSWAIAPSGSSITGTGELQGPARLPVAPRRHAVEVSSVVRFETDRRVRRSSDGLTVLGVLTSLFVAAALPAALAYGAVHDR